MNLQGMNQKLDISGDDVRLIYKGLEQIGLRVLAADSAGMAGHEVYSTPKLERTRISGRETVGFAEGALGSTVGTAGVISLAGGSAVLLGFEGRPGWLVLTLGIGGVLLGGVAGPMEGHAGTGTLYKAEKSFIEFNTNLERSISNLFG